MECLLGIRGKDFVLLASDTLTAHSILLIKHDTDKFYKLNSKVAMVAVGERGDAIEFCERMEKNIQLYKMRNAYQQSTISGYDLSPKGCANFIRNQLAHALRSDPRHVNTLMGGVDEHSGTAELYYLDYLGTLVPLPFGAHGYGAHFSLGIFDRHYRPDISQEEAYTILEKCVKEIKARFLVQLPTFQVRVVDSSGIRDLKNIAA